MDDEPRISINDVSGLEGNSGTTLLTFTVSLSAASDVPVSVNFATPDGTALEPAGLRGHLRDADLCPRRNLQIDPGPGSRRPSGRVQRVVLRRPQRRDQLADHGWPGDRHNRGRRPAQPTITINDVEVWEGNSGTTLMTVTVSLAAAYDQVVTVNYATLEGAVAADQSYLTIAIAGQDYQATSGTLTFSPGETTKTIMVEIIGDPYSEFNEMFVVNLSGASANALIIDGQGFGTIMDDLGWINTEYGNYLYDGASYY